MTKNSVEKKLEKLESMKKLIEYAKSLLILLITVIICSFLTLNLIFVGYVPTK